MGTRLSLLYKLNAYIVGSLQPSHTTTVPLPTISFSLFFFSFGTRVCWLVLCSLSLCRQVAIKLQDPVEHVGMLQLVLCRVGMLSVFLDMVKLLSLLSRSINTQKFDHFNFLISIHLSFYVIINASHWCS